MLKHKTILISCVAALLAGCTMIPKYERPASTVGTQYQGVTKTNASNASDIGWETVFTDDRLKKLIRLALTNNVDYQVAVLNVEQSRAQYRVTRSSSFPSVSAKGNFTRYGNDSTSSESWSASLGTTAYEVDLFGRVRSQNRQALEKFFATAEAQRSARISLLAEVATEYFILRQAEEQICLAQDTLKSVEDSYTLNKANFEAGASSELDLRTAEGQVQTAKINLLTYERNRALAVNCLELLIGQPLPTDLPSASPFNATNLVAEVSPGLPSELVQRRPDILQAEHTLRAANANIGMARAAFFPTITLTASMGSSSEQLTKLLGSGTGLWSFSPQITLPIFTAGQNKADFDSAKISKRIDVAKYQKAIETAFREVSDALVASRSYASQIEAEIILISAQQRRYELANLRYRQGDDNYLNVLSAQQALYNAQQEYLQTQFQKLSSHISLYKALGGGWK